MTKLHVDPPRFSLTTFRIGQEGMSPETLHVACAHGVPSRRSSPAEDQKGAFDVALPLLAPSRGLLRKQAKMELTRVEFLKSYRVEMAKRNPQQAIELLANVATRLPVAVGCHCEDEGVCHRTELSELIRMAAPSWIPGEVHLQAWEEARATAGRMSQDEAVREAGSLVGSTRMGGLCFGLFVTPSRDALAKVLCTISAHVPGGCGESVATGRNWEEAFEELRTVFEGGSLDTIFKGVLDVTAMVNSLLKANGRRREDDQPPAGI